MNDPKLAIAGLIIGVLVGMTGMGGGSLMTPILILLFNFNPTIAIGTDILHGAVFKSFGAVRHRRLGTVLARLGSWMFVGSAPMSLLGVWVATYLTDRYGDSIDSVQGRILGVTLLLGAVAFVAKAFAHGKPTGGLKRLTPRDRVKAIAIGAVGGFIVGLTSVGSGTFFALMMALSFPLAARYIVGTDVFHAAALLWVAGFGHLGGRKRESRCDRLAPRGFDPRRPGREPGERAATRPCASANPRGRARPERGRAP